MSQTSKPSILLIFPPYSDNICFQTTPPLGINYLKSILQKQGFDAAAVDLNLAFITTEKLLNHKSDNQKKYDFSEVFPLFKNLKECLKDYTLDDLAYNLYLSSLNFINAFRYDVIGFSVAFAHQLPRAIEMARIIRHLHPEIKLIIGGSQITLLTPLQIEMLRKSQIFDSIMCGNGEETLPYLLEHIKNDAPNIEIIKAKPLTKDAFNSLETTDFSDIKDYFEPRFIPILIGNGCHWGKCSFCDYKRLSQNILLRKPEDVFAEIKSHNENINPSGFILISDAIPPNWYLKLCNLAISENYKLKTSGYMLHDKNLDNHFFQTLSKAGVYEINFGTESLNNRVLKLMNKKADYETIKQNLKAAAFYNIIISSNIIADFPNASFEEIMDTAQKIEQLESYIDCLNVQYFDLTYGCDVFNNPDKFDIIIDKNYLTSGSHGFHGVKFKRKKPFTKTQITLIKNRYQELIDLIKKKDNVNKKTALFLS